MDDRKESKELDIENISEEEAFEYTASKEKNQEEEIESKIERSLNNQSVFIKESKDMIMNSGVASIGESHNKLVMELKSKLQLIKQYEYPCYMTIVLK